MTFARRARGLPVATAFLLVAGACAAESEAPVRLEAEVAVKDGQSYVQVEVVNISQGKVVVCRNLEGGAVSWSVSGFIKSEGDWFSSVGSGSSGCGFAGAGGMLGALRRFAADAERTVTLAPGESHRVLIPFDGATKMLARREIPMEGATATLHLRNVIAQSAGADDETTMALYARWFQMPTFKFSDGAWKRWRN